MGWETAASVSLIATLGLGALLGRAEAIIANEVVGIAEIAGSDGVFRERSAAAAELPQLRAARPMSGTGPLVVEGSQEMPAETTRFGDNTLRRFRSRALSSGAYGRLTFQYARSDQRPTPQSTIHHQKPGGHFYATDCRLN